MPTSELSNALNPYASQSRSHTSISGYTPPFSPVVQPPQQYVPHRSELELAISEPPPPPLPPPINAVRPRQPTSGSIQAVQELLRIVAATREEQEIERKRRLAWEQEQEAKYAQRQAEMERQMLEMRQELLSLPNVNHTPSSGLFTPQYSMSPALSVQRPPRPTSPISPISQTSSYTPSMFMQGSSNTPLLHHPQLHGSTNDFQGQQLAPPITIVEPQLSSVTPAPSPRLNSAKSPQLYHESSASPVTGRKRLSSQLSSDEEDHDAVSDSSASNVSRPVKRMNHHDKRCLTIHHALREHILRLMDLENDKNLPDSHPEGVPLGSDEPIRFVWEKTAKQSTHNSRMKARVLADIKSKRKIYKYVPDKDFSKKVLDAAFDQSFVTFRQKFKAQRDSVTAATFKRREEVKAQKARHLSRRKIKLTNRSDARMKAGIFDHVTFDGAFQIECMSSEESDVEVDPNSPTRSSEVLRTRGYLWRSTRLMKFYSVLDDEEKADKYTKPKRGSGRKERCTGPPKDGFHLPPQGVATWMISRRWIRSSRLRYPDFTDVLARLVEDPPGFDWGRFDMLGNGEETDDSNDDLQTLHGQHSLPPHHISSSSLNYALA